MKRLPLLLLSACASDPFTDSETYLRLSLAGQEAYDVLRAAPFFSDACVGFACIPPPTVEGFRVLIEEPEADAAFEALLAEANLEGQLFGLVGIYFTDPTRFDRYAAPYRRSNVKVDFRSGCVGRRTTARELTGEIADGSLPHSIRGR